MNALVKLIFNEDLVYSFGGHNIFNPHTYLKEYSTDDERCAEVLSDFLSSNIVCNLYQGSSSFDSMLRTIATAQLTLILIYILRGMFFNIYMYLNPLALKEHCFVSHNKC